MQANQFTIVSNEGDTHVRARLPYTHVTVHTRAEVKHVKLAAAVRVQGTKTLVRGEKLLLSTGTGIYLMCSLYMSTTAVMFRNQTREALPGCHFGRKRPRLSERHFYT